MPTTHGDVLIGHDVWIGTNVTILSGVSVGNGAILAAGALVASDVAPFSVVAGVPAREIRTRFSEEQIAALERIAWWNWPDSRVLENIHLLSSEEITGFLSAHDPRRNDPGGDGGGSAG